MFECCINAADSLMFDVFYGMSNNDLRWVDIEHAHQIIGYVSEDRAEEYHIYDSVQRK